MDRRAVIVKHPSSGPRAGYDTLVESFLEVAEETIEAERRIKEEVLALARRGDCKRMAELVERWMKEPAVEVAAELERRAR